MRGGNIAIQPYKIFNWKVEEPQLSQPDFSSYWGTSILLRFGTWLNAMQLMMIMVMP